MNHGLFPKYAKASLDNLHPDTPRDIVALVKKISKMSKEAILKANDNMYLNGGNRVGKTYALHAIANKFISLGIKSTLIVSATDLAKYFQERTINRDYDALWTDVAAEKKILLIDGLGKEYKNSQSGFFESQINSLVRKRVENMRITFIESKYSVEELSSVYGEEFADLIRGEFICFDIKDNVNMSNRILSERII